MAGKEGFVHGKRSFNQTYLKKKTKTNKKQAFWLLISFDALNNMVTSVNRDFLNSIPKLKNEK